MRAPSRSMPRLPPNAVTPTGWLVGVGLATLLVWLFWSYPWTGAVAALVVSISVLLGIRERRLLDALAATRSEDSICTFARAFDCREIDTWVLRAVYEELQRHVAPGRNLPIRPSDRLKEDLLLDDDDLDLDLAHAISQRTGRTLENAEANPFYAKVINVRDLVMFFAAQPKTTDALMP